MSQRFSFDRTGRWSGGGQVFLRNVEHAEQRHAVLRGGSGAIPVIARNVPARRAVPDGPFVLAPQNAWPWAPSGAERDELRRLVALRLASEFFCRRAIGVMRISSSIPKINQSRSPVIHNVLDTGFEEALKASRQALPPDSAAGAFVTVGSMNSYRNLVNLIHGFGRYRAAGGSRRLWIAGTPGSSGARREIEQAAETVDGLTIRWHSLSRTECLAVLRNAAAVILPSKVEASPVAALEAVASNPNVVTSRIVGHTEILSEYGKVPRECLFDPYTPDHIAEVLGVAEANVDAGVGPLADCHAALSDAREREIARMSWGDRLASWLLSLNPTRRHRLNVLKRPLITGTSRR